MCCNTVTVNYCPLSLLCIASFDMMPFCIVSFVFFLCSICIISSNHVVCVCVQVISKALLTFGLELVPLSSQRMKHVIEDPT